MANSKPLRLLDFPIIIHRKIIPLLPRADCVDIALRSSKFRKVIQNSKKIQIVSLEWNFYDSFDITLEFENDLLLSISRPKGISIWRQKKFNKPLKSSELRFTRKAFDPEEPDLIKIMPRSDICFNRATVMGVMELVTNILMEFVDVEKFDLRVKCTKNIGFLNCFVWKYQRHFSDVFFSAPHNEDYTDELDFLLKETTADSMSLSLCHQNLPKKYSTPLKSKSMNITWMESYPIELLCKMETQKVRFQLMKMKCSDFNQVIKEWLKGGLQKLEHFRVKLNNVGEINEEEVLDGVKTIKPKKRRPEGLLANGDPKEEIHEIQRKSDRKIATVAFDEWNFVFAVWPEDKEN